MYSTQIVFLFDLSSCRDFLFKTKEELNKKLLSIRLSCLRLLTDFSSKSPNLKWGYKFFDSDGSKTQIMYKFACCDVSLENFETFENEICVRYERHLSFLQALSESAQKNDNSVNKKFGGQLTVDSPVKVLQFALTQILCEFQWESTDMWSPSVKKIKTFSTQKRNYLFVFSDFQDSDELLFKYFGLNNCISKSKFIDTFVPQSLRDSLLRKYNIHLILLNTCLEQKFMGSCASKILPLLSYSLQALQGSLIPLLILSQPIYNMKSFNGRQKTICEGKVILNPNLCSSFHNSVIPFSYIFEQSLDQPFYSTVNTSTFKCSIEFMEKDVPIQVLEIFNKKSNNEGSGFLKNLERKKITWSKFIIHFAVPRNFYNTVYEMLLCLPNVSQSSAPEAGELMNLNKKMCIEGVDLVLECITECGIKMPGIITPLSKDAALIFVLDPSVNYLMFKSDCKICVTNSLKNTNQDNSNGIKNCTTEVKNFTHHIKTENASDITCKPFHVECLESWFKPTSVVSKVVAHIESKPSSNLLKMESFWQLLKQSVRGGEKLSQKFSKSNLINGLESSSDEKRAENLADPENQTIEDELPDLNYGELLSTVKDIYNSAIELSANIVTSAKRILDMIVNYCTKHSNTSSIEDDVYNIFRDNLSMTALKISEKYEMFESQEATQQKIKECQIQVLLILGIENIRKCPERSNCVNIVTSLLRVMVFYSGIEELQNFLHDVVKKRYSSNLYDILIEIGDELNISIFDDAESSHSPADTLSSFNDDEVFSSVVSSVLSEKSTSSISSRNGNKDNNMMERKLIRHRSDISDTSRYRQVLLPNSSAKKKKKKNSASKAIRYSPRIAAKKNENISEKPSKVRRNLFAGDKCNHTPKKIHQPSTPKSKKKNYVTETKYAAETPSHEQNLSVVQRRKSIVDHLSSMKIDESPKILKTAKDNASKEFREKLEKANQESKKLKLHCHNIKECTPESKRRLSLKLFSSPGSRMGIYTSPTARMGVKKCTKRLFHETSPQKAVENNKKHKSNNTSNLPSHLIDKNETFI